MPVPSVPTIVTVVAPMRTTRSSPAHRLGTEYTAPSSRTIARGVTVAKVVASGQTDLTIVRRKNDATIRVGGAE